MYVYAATQDSLYQSLHLGSRHFRLNPRSLFEFLSSGVLEGLRD